MLLIIKGDLCADWIVDDRVFFLKYKNDYRENNLSGQTKNVLSSGFNLMQIKSFILCELWVYLLSRIKCQPSYSYVLDTVFSKAPICNSDGKWKNGFCRTILITVTLVRHHFSLPTVVLHVQPLTDRSANKQTEKFMGYSNTALSAGFFSFSLFPFVFKSQIVSIAGGRCCDRMRAAIRARLKQSSWKMFAYLIVGSSLSSLVSVDDW